MIISSSCKNVKLDHIAGFKRKESVNSGDILLAEVLSIGKYAYRQIEEKSGDLRKIKLGDKMLVVQGNRYATKFCEILVSNKNIVLGNLGGVVGKPLSVDKEKFTKLKIIGYAYNKKGIFLNLKDYPKKSCSQKLKANTSKVIVVIGSDMDSGKTTCASDLSKKISLNGGVVNYGKITGTSRLKDLMLLKNNGAKIVLDFNDCGFASTYKTGKQNLKKILKKIYSSLSINNPDYIILEIADGVLQNETKIILKEKMLNSFNPKIVFCCRESMAVGEANRVIRKAGMHISFVSGPVANSKLSRDEVERNFGIQCISRLSLNTALVKNNFYKN